MCFQKGSEVSRFMCVYKKEEEEKEIILSDTPGGITFIFFLFKISGLVQMKKD